MNWIDKAIGYVAPKAGYERAKARIQMDVSKRYFDAVTTGRQSPTTRRLVGDANLSSKAHLTDLRSLSRDLFRNNAYAKRAVEVITTNVVGKGIIPQFKRDGIVDDQLEALAVKFFDTLACDADGLHNYYGLQSLIVQTVVLSGECLIRRRRRNSSQNLPVPIQFQVLEPDFLDSSKDGDQRGRGPAIQGVQFDNNGKRTGYWLFERHPGAGSGGASASQFVPAEDVIHCYRVDRPGQARGIPWLAPCILRLSNLSDYEYAQLVRQKIAACFSAFVIGADDLASDPKDTDPDPIEFQPGMFRRLGPGESIEFAEPPGVDGYNDYLRAQIRAVASGVGITYESISGDLSGVNFSSGRMGWLEMARNIERWREQTFVARAFEQMAMWFVDAASLRGASVDTVTVTHTAPRRQMINPAQEIPAIRDAVRAGFMTIGQAIQESGEDPETHLQEIAAYNQRMDELGLVFDSDARRVSRAGLTQGRTPGTEINWDVEDAEEN